MSVLKGDTVYENKDKNEIERDRKIKEQFAFFLGKGYTYRYLYQKGGDSACVYIYRFLKNRDFFDVREVSGGNELNFVVCVGGEFSFPALKGKYKKEYWAFSLRHLLKRSTQEERRAFLAKILQKEYESEVTFFGIEK